MPHARRQILDAVIAALKGLPTTADRVFEDDPSAVATTKLPALAVDAGPEPEIEYPAGSFSDAVELQKRPFIVLVTSLAHSPQERDESTLEVEKAIANLSIGHRRRLLRVLPQRLANVEKRVWMMQGHFEITYGTRSNAPDVIV